MSETAIENGTIPGSSVQLVGGGLVALSLAVSIWAFVGGDSITGGAVLLYVIVGFLLFTIGRSAELV